MNRKTILTALIIFTIAIGGCGKKAELSEKEKALEKVHVADGVGSDTATSNIIIRPVAYFISDLIGQGLVAKDVTQRVGKSGYLEVYITLHNQSWRTKQFEYKFEWLDSADAILDTKTSVWLPFSIAGNTDGTIKGIAPRTDAANFRVITRKSPK